MKCWTGSITSWIKTARRNNNLRYADDTTLMAKSEEELKSLMMRVKEESEKAGLKLNIQKTNIMASAPITSRQIDGETKETVSDFIFLGSKIIADGDCSHEIRRLLLLGKKAMTNLNSVLKSRDITLLTKVYTVKAVYLHPAYLTYMQSTSCEMLGWMKHKLESRLPGEIIITSDMQMTPPLWQKVKRTKEPLDEGEKRE